MKTLGVPGPESPSELVFWKLSIEMLLGPVEWSDLYKDFKNLSSVAAYGIHNLKQGGYLTNNSMC